jgi:hypothetical protein
LAALQALPLPVQLLHHQPANASVSGAEEAEVAGAAPRTIIDAVSAGVMLVSGAERAVAPAVLEPSPGAVIEPEVSAGFLDFIYNDWYFAGRILTPSAPLAVHDSISLPTRSV